MNNLYKYRVNKKWYTFDKSILDPQDVMIFEKADWSDKLKIIKIYEDLHSVEGDDVQILSTKKIDDKKDKRRREYERKKEAINNKITEANKINNTEAAEKAIKELEELKIEYADIVEINSANIVNIAKAQDVNIKNINKLVLDAQTQLKDIKQNLTEADFENIKNSLNEIINSKSSEEIKEIIEGLKTEVKDIQENSLKPDMLNAFYKTIDKMINNLYDIKDHKFYDDIIENNLTKIEFGNDMPLIKKYNLVSEKIIESGITLADFNFIKEYHLSFEFVKQFKNPLKALKYLAGYIKIFEQLDENAVGNKYLLLEKVESKGNLNTSDVHKAVASNLIYPKTGEDGKAVVDTDKMEDIFKNVGFTGNIKKFIYLRSTTKIARNPQSLYFTEYLEVTGVNYFKDIKEIYENKKIPEAEKPGAIEEKDEGGFLGLKTNKQAKKDFENLQNQINDLSNQVKELQKQISDLRNPNPTYHKLFDDIQKGVELRKINPVETHASKQNSLLIDTLNKRRQDIEPDEYEEDNEDVWGNGFDLVEIPKACSGGLLAELKKDLEKYGLMLKVWPKNPGAYFVNVFDKRKPLKGKGIEEAKQITEEAKNNGSYQSIKELYEDLYN